MSAYARNSESQGILCIFIQSSNSIIIIIIIVVVVVVVVIIIQKGASSYLAVLSIRYMSFDLNKVLECTVIDTRVDLLTEVVAAKMGKSYTTTNLSWIRARLSFALLRSALLCLTLSLPRSLPLISKIICRLRQSEIY